MTTVRSSFYRKKLFVCPFRYCCSCFALLLQSMLVLIIPFFLLLLFCFFVTLSYDWRQAWLETFVFFGTVATLIIEILSPFSQIHQVALFCAWLICTLAIILYLLKSHKIEKIKKYFSVQNFLSLRHQLSKSDFSLYYILFIFLLTGFIAVKMPPSTMDALAYHMSRVTNWMQNQNVIHYPTNAYRQLDQPPASSFFLLHLQSLSGGDLWAGLVQWFSMVGSVIGVSLIARELGANFKGQLLSSLFAATLPLGILQASTVQNDHVITFWLVCFTYGILFALNHPNNLQIFIFSGLSLGLACLSKGSAYFLALPLVCLLFPLVGRYFKQNKLKLLSIGGILLVTVVLLNIGHWFRNYVVFGSPLGITGDGVKTELLSLNAIISSTIRAFVIHLAIPVGSFNEAIENGVLWIHKYILHLDPSDPRLTYTTRYPFRIAYWGTSNEDASTTFSLNENVTTNFVHFLLIPISTLAYGLNKRLRTPVRSGYIFAMFASFFISAILIKWMPSATRYQMPVFILFSAVFGIVFSNIFNRRTVFMGLLTGLLVLNSLPCLLFSNTRSLLTNNFFHTNFSVFSLSREDIRDLRPFYRDYKTAVQAMQKFKCNVVGLDAIATTEYSLWVAFEKSLKPDEKLPNLQSVVVINDSQQQINVHPSRKETPCAVYVLDLQKIPAQSNEKNQLEKGSLQDYILIDKSRDRILRYQPVYIGSSVAAYILKGYEPASES